MKKLKTFANWVKQATDWLKTVGIVFFMSLFLMSIIKSGCDRRHTEELIEKLTGLRVTNSILLSDVKEGNRIIKTLNADIATYQDTIRMLIDELTILKSENTDLIDEKNKLAAEMLKISVDSSYKFLTKVAYPQVGEQKYPFNEPQVRGIHLTYLEKFSLERINTNLNNQISNYVEQLDAKDKQQSLYSQTIDQYRINDVRYTKIIDNKDDEIQILEKQIKRKHNQSKFWKITTGIAAGAAIFIAL